VCLEGSLISFINVLIIKEKKVPMSIIYNSGKDFMSTYYTSNICPFLKSRCKNPPPMLVIHTCLCS
jgi:hypothetical protein